MRALVLAGTTLTALLAPVAAYPCSQALGIFGAAPAEHVPFPANGQLIVGVSPSSEYIESAELDYGTDGLPIELDVRPFGPYHAVIELPEILGRATVYASVENGPSGPDFLYSIQNLAAEDLVPPTDPTNFQLEAEWIEFDMCFGPGLSISGSFTTGQDDVGVAAHVVSRFLPNDAQEIVGVTFESGNAPTPGPNRSFNLFWPRREAPQNGESICLHLQALDRAHNWSSPYGTIACVQFGDPPPPPPPVDAGFVDAGNPVPPAPRDGGMSATPDAGTPNNPPTGGGGLATADPGCGCASTASATGDSAAPGFVLFALALVVRRRLSRPRR